MISHRKNIHFKIVMKYPIYIYIKLSLNSCYESSVPYQMQTLADVSRSSRHGVGGRTLSVTRRGAPNMGSDIWVVVKTMVPFWVP